MEHAPLRPVPARPAGPIDPATALREVGSWLPTLSPVAARALALVVLAERPRAEVAASLGVSEADLGALLAEARKELRQTISALGGSGWCERAEGLISDRLDGALAERDVRRLDVHLRNCSRCVEHERRLVQATDALVRSLGGRPSPTVTPPVPLVEAPDAPAEAEPPAGDGIEGSAPEEAASAPEAGLDEVGPAASEPAAQEVAPTGGQIAAAAEVLVAARTRRQIAAAVAWNALIAIAVLLTLAVIALTLAGILGAQL
jgi:putative zinc finger protein